MICEIIAVGTELLLGSIANTNGQKISQMLSEHGIAVYYHTVCGDNPARLTAALDIAKNRADIIITTGGLGPTADDLTKETIAAAFGKKLVLDPVQHKRLHDRMGTSFTPNNEKQAFLPEDCTPLDNEFGTAPGCAFLAEGTHVIMLPGPPSECIPMFKNGGLPYLRALTGGVIASFYLRIFGMGESTAEHMLTPLINSLNGVTAATYAGGGECQIRVTAMGETYEQAESACTPVVAEMRRILGDVVYGVNVDSLEQVVVSGLCERKLTLATAESCTGGLLSKRITDISGSSACFVGGFVTYSNEMKMRSLGVSEKSLAQYGAVSEQVAIEMARGARVNAGADIGIGITGIAGPEGGSEQKPVGTVFIAIAHQGGERVIQIPLRKRRTRENVRTTAAGYALDLIRREMQIER